MREFTLPAGQVILLDNEDYDRVAAHKWSFHAEKGRVKMQKTGELLTHFLKGKPCSFRNGNVLDHRGENLSPFLPKVHSLEGFATLTLSRKAKAGPSLAKPNPRSEAVNDDAFARAYAKATA